MQLSITLFNTIYFGFTDSSTSIIVDDATTTTITVNWVVQTSVLISSLLISDTNKLIQKFATAENKTTITGLQPGTLYNITVFTFTRTKQSAPATIIQSTGMISLSLQTTLVLLRNGMPKICFFES